MSDQLSQVLTTLAHRAKATRDREIRAKGVYAKFLLGDQPGSDSADGVIGAMDELGLEIEQISRDLVETKFAQMIESLIAENDQAVAEARSAILAAKRELTAARGSAFRGAVDRATANLREKVSYAVNVEEYGEALRRALKPFSHRARGALQSDVDAATVVMREADQRQKQAAASRSSRAAPNPEHQTSPVQEAHPPSTVPGAKNADPLGQSVPESKAPGAEAVANPSAPLGEPIIPDLTPKPVAEQPFA